ncbi:MAG: hypothetical protein SGJ19_15820 [Planctomycetia bacterium]|nr:hypothetical protein [Planctomycetia bacterium]
MKWTRLKRRTAHPARTADKEQLPDSAMEQRPRQGNTCPEIGATLEKTGS